MKQKTDGGWRWVVESVYIDMLLITLFINVFETFHSQRFTKAIPKIPHTVTLIIINSSS